MLACPHLVIKCTRAFYSVGLESVQNVDLRVWTDERDLKTEVMADFVARNNGYSMHTVGLERLSCSVDALSVSHMTSEVSARVFELYTEAKDIYLLGAKTGERPGSLNATVSDIYTDRVWEAFRALQVFKLNWVFFF
jgi:hypothetical protein